MELQYIATPFAHLRAKELVAPELYEKMRFPDLSKRPMGRIGYDLYRGEEGWQEVVRQPGWNELYRTVSSLSFVQKVLNLFRNDLRKYGCLIDVDRIYLEEFNENRTLTQSTPLSNDYDPNALFTRFDFQAIDASYDKGVHVDHPRRVVGGVLFMSNANDEGIEGGEFGLFSDRDFNNDRMVHSPKLEAKYLILGNTGTIFLNFNGGFHGPLPMTRARGMRRWIYYSISSRRDVWLTNPLRSLVHKA